MPLRHLSPWPLFAAWIVSSPAVAQEGPCLDLSTAAGLAVLHLDWTTAGFISHAAMRHCPGAADDRTLQFAAAVGAPDDAFLSQVRWLGEAPRTRVYTLVLVRAWNEEVMNVVRLAESNLGPAGEVAVVLQPAARNNSSDADLETALRATGSKAKLGFTSDPEPLLGFREGNPASRVATVLVYEESLLLLASDISSLLYVPTFWNTGLQRFLAAGGARKRQDLTADSQRLADIVRRRDNAAFAAFLPDVVRVETYVSEGAGASRRLVDVLTRDELLAVDDCGSEFIDGVTHDVPWWSCLIGRELAPAEDGIPYAGGVGTSGKPWDDWHSGFQGYNLSLEQTPSGVRISTIRVGLYRE